MQCLVAHDHYSHGTAEYPYINRKSSAAGGVKYLGRSVMSISTLVVEREEEVAIYLYIGTEIVGHNIRVGLVFIFRR